MTKTSPAKPKQNPRQSLIELLEDSAAIFQAVGILPGDVAFSAQGASTAIGRRVKSSPRRLVTKTPC